VNYEDELRACVEARRGATSVSAYPVNSPMIAMWTDALRDANPVYADDAAARASGRPGVIAPPTMIQAWAMPPLSQMAQNRSIPGYRPYWREVAAAARDAGKPSAPDAPDAPDATAHEVLRKHGFSNSAATNCRQEYHRELVPGDHTTCVTTLDSISPLKHTAMGDGHFVTNRMEYLDARGKPVATQLWTVLQFRTPTADELKAGAASRAGRASRAGERAAGAEEAPVPGGPLAGVPAVGRRTPDIVIPITPTFVVATAIATRDYYAIHHDTDWARSIGRPGIFTNILTTTGLVGQVMTNWAGPATRLKSIDLRLLAPNYPGDELTLRGKVSAVDGDLVTLEVTGTNAIGTHVRATVTGHVSGA
jgi:N-terminal half of MaoC dehydratase/MaoC like domain